MAELVHLEILGPRAGLDAWLATLQEAGCCHVADALRGLVGEPGIGRPRPREEERRAGELRSGPLLALRSLEGVLPPAAPRSPDDPPAAWSLPPGGVDEDVLARRCEEALALATRIAGGFEAVREAERGAAARGGAEAQEALEAARRALAARLAGDGPLARRALDGLEDAEAREAEHRRLASTGHVTAARVYVPRERVADLLARLDRAHAAAVVVRSLPPRDDAPAPHGPPPVLPLEALCELAPSRFGPRAAMGTLVLVAAVATAFEWADGGYAIGLLAAGAVLGWRSPPGTQRRAAAATLLALGLGALAGALCGGTWFGTFAHEGLAPHLTPGLALHPERGAEDVWAAVVASTALLLLAYALLGGALGLGRSTRPRWFSAAGCMVLPALFALYAWRPGPAPGGDPDAGRVWANVLLAAVVWIGILLLVGAVRRAWALLADAASLLLCLLVCGLALAAGSHAVTRADDLPPAVLGFLGALAMLVGAATSRWRGPRDVWNETSRPPFSPWRRAGALRGDA